MEDGFLKKEEKKEEPPKPYECCWCPCWDSAFCKFYLKHSFLVNAVLAILLAYLIPSFAGDYLYPDITASYVAVIFIFIMSGISLKSKELKKALANIKFNLFVQFMNFGVVSIMVFGLSRALISFVNLDRDLADGMVICVSLPMTVNMVIVLTKSSGGNEASALFNASFGSVLGVFITPALILGYLGQESNIDIVATILKLCYRIIVPLIVGQII